MPIGILHQGRWKPWPGSLIRLQTRLKMSLKKEKVDSVDG
jgi:hypothetical protein